MRVIMGRKERRHKMDKHTFQVGDRVIIGDATKDDYSVSRCGESGVLKRVCGNGYEVALDKQELNRDEGIWYVSYGDLRHDTDFQVGDWVRYEGVSRNTTRSKEGQIGQITNMWRNDRGNWATAKGINGHLAPANTPTNDVANLVKIQPPQEEKMRNVFNITHEKYGVVQGVHQVAPGCYCKNGAYYYHGEGWRETEEWVKIEVRKSQWETINTQIGTFEAWGVDQNYHTVSWRPAK